MDREELKKYLPHREPMLLVDEIEIDSAGVAHARYRIREDEFFCRGHFPDNPVVPGVMQCEIMAQGCAMLLKDELVGKTPLYSGIDRLRFKAPVHPGDMCEVTATLTGRRANMFFCDAVLSVDGKVCCKGSLSFALV